MRHQIVPPLLARLLQMKDVILVREQENFLRCLFDLDVSAHGKIDHGRCDIAGMNESSSKVPASAGEIPVGGPYIGATDMPGSGSRPLYHHSRNIAIKVTGGRNTTGLLPMNQKNFVNALGSSRIPFGI